MCDAATTTTTAFGDQLALDELAAANSSSSILEFLNHEQRCLLTETARTISSATAASRRVRYRSDDGADGHMDDDNDDGTSEELDIESIFSEIQRLSGGMCRSGGGDGSLPERSVDEILREAEELIGRQEQAAAAAAVKRAQQQRRVSSQYAACAASVSSSSRLSSGRGTERTVHEETDAGLGQVSARNYWCMVVVDAA